MADVDQVFLDRWRSGDHLGDKRPRQYARVRRGYFYRANRPFTFLDGTSEDFATMPGGHDHTPWFPLWTPLTAWKTLPNVTEVSKNQGFDNNGFQSATIQLENIVYKAIAGVLGTYHAISRGDLSPWRGFTNFGRHITDAWMGDKNEWYQLLVGAQIEVWQGYGTGHDVKTYTGLVDDVDMTSNPDHMTLTTTCFGTAMLGQQRVFNAVKDPKMRAPITFADRLKNVDLKKVGGGAKASSHQKGSSAANITRANDHHDWTSVGHDGPDYTEWVEIHVPRGRYESIAVFPKWRGMELFISVYNRDIAKGTPSRSTLDPRYKPAKAAQVDDVNVAEGWYDPVSGGSWSSLTQAERDARIASGDHVVPGANGGFPWVQHIKHNDNVLKYHRMNGLKFEVGDNTVFRVSWRKLHYHPPDRNWTASVKRLFAVSVKEKKTAKKNNWILVDDAADVVKVVLRWAGFREWEVESFGVKLKDPLVFHQSDFLVDIVKKLTEWADYNFFMGDPTSDDLSTGVPKFRHSRALTGVPTTNYEVRDTDLLTGINVKLSQVPKATRIFARGANRKKSKGGVQVGEDHEFRVTASYVTPWKRRGEMSGVIKQVLHFDKMLKSQLDCEVMCRLIAAQQALQAATGGIEIPGMPGLELDDQVSVLDEGTGTNTRLWIAHRADTYTTSPDGAVKWTTQLQGSWIDTLDVQTIAIDLAILMNRQQNDEDAAPVATGGKAQRPGVTAGGPGVFG